MDEEQLEPCRTCNASLFAGPVSGYCRAKRAACARHPDYQHRSQAMDRQGFELTPDTLLELREQCDGRRPYFPTWLVSILLDAFEAQVAERDEALAMTASVLMPKSMAQFTQAVVDCAETLQRERDEARAWIMRWGDPNRAPLPWETDDD